MLRFVKEYLATSEHADSFGIFSLVVFTGFFLAVIIRIMRMKKSYVEELSNLPLGSEDMNQNEQP